MPRPGSSPRLPPRVLLAGALCAGPLLLAAYLALAPASDWRRPLLLAALLGLATVATRCEAALPGRVALGSLTGITLLAVALLGPGPALLVALVALVVPAAEGRERLLRPGNLVNALAAAADVLAVALVLAALGRGPVGLLAAVVVQLLVDWVVGPLLYGALWVGSTRTHAVSLLARGAPSEALVGTLAAGAVLAWPVAGELALAVFALVVVVPQATLAWLARTGPVVRLDRSAATARYAQALALEAGLGREARERVAAAARIVAVRRPTGHAVDHMVATLTDRSAAACDAGHLTEWWDGSGGPAALHGGMIPVAARILAVADTWSALTAAGSPSLTHAQAVSHLRSEAGERLDPDVVEHAARIALGLAPAGQVGLCDRPLPALVRRRLVPGPVAAVTLG